MSKRLVATVSGLVVVLVGAAQCATASPSLHQTSRHVGTRAHASAAKMCGLRSRAGTYKHVIVLFEENNAYSSIYHSYSAPYINSMIKSCGLATNYHNITHPSLPNYLAATNGGTLAQVTTPFESDCTPSAQCESNANNIFHQLDARRHGWKAYAESMPSACDRSSVGPYAPRHNPAVYYTDLAHCAARDVPLGTSSNSPLLKDFSSEKTAPAFSWITPNLCDDMHGTTGCKNNLVSRGDSWLKRWLPKITSSRVYKSGDTAIFIAWDEGEPGTKGEACATNTSDPGCHVVLIVVAPSVKRGRRAGKLLNHYSLLRTAEDLLGIHELRSAKTASSMAGPFNL